MLVHKTPSLFHYLYPSLTWKKEVPNKSIFITFDDGPIPEVTEFVLETLSNFNAKATFFCVGENVKRNPELFKWIVTSGHAVGNHTHNHIKGWSTDDNTYYRNILMCDMQMSSVLGAPPQKKLFRPPYGRIKFGQADVLSKHYEIIMWDVLTGDYSGLISPETCLEKTIQSTEPGSIVVFHDSIKAKKNLYYVLPKYLEYCSEQGYSFLALE